MAGKQWNAIGIAVSENYACAWFGEVADPKELPQFAAVFRSSLKRYREAPVIAKRPG